MSPKPRFNVSHEIAYRHGDKSNDCWLWPGTIGADGYGKTRHNGATRSTHRLSWECVNGPIPKGLVVRHRCDNRSCFRPDHLEVGTNAENSRDMVERGRHKNRYTQSDRCRYGHVFGDRKRTRPDGYVLRECDTCIQRNRKFAYRAGKSKKDLGLKYEAAETTALLARRAELEAALDDFWSAERQSHLDGIELKLIDQLIASRD